MIEIDGQFYEPAENSAAKNIALYALEKELDRQGIEVDDLETDEVIIDLIDLADVVVEALLEAGVTIPEDIKD